MSNKQKRCKLLAFFLQNIENWASILTEENLKDIFGFLKSRFQTECQSSKSKSSSTLDSSTFFFQQFSRSQQNTAREQKKCCQCRCKISVQGKLKIQHEMMTGSQFDPLVELEKLYSEFSSYTQSLAILSRQLEMIYNVKITERLGDSIFEPITTFINNVKVEDGKKEEALALLQNARLNIQDFDYILTYNQNRMDQINNMIEYQIEVAKNSIRSFSKKLIKHGFTGIQIESWATKKDKSSDKENKIVSKDKPHTRALSEKARKTSQNEPDKQFATHSQEDPTHSQEEATHSQEEIGSQQSKLSQKLRKNNI